VEQLERGLSGSSALSKDDFPTISKCATKTKPGSLPGKPIKTNQDSYIVINNFMKNKK
jgi:hypothetical protein